jgi:hypothetical protein
LQRDVVVIELHYFADDATGGHDLVGRINRK